MATAWTLQRLAPPTERAVSLEQAKLNLRFTSAAMPLDSEIISAIDAATEQWEQDTDSPAIAAQYMQARCSFPASGAPIVLSKRPIQSVDFIQYDTGDDVQTQVTLPESEYSVDLGRREIYRKTADSWPQSAFHNEAVQITYTAGYKDATTVPRYVQRAIMLQVHRWIIDPGMEFSEQARFEYAYESLVTKHLATFHSS